MQTTDSSESLWLLEFAWYAGMTPAAGVAAVAFAFAACVFRQLGRADRLSAVSGFFVLLIAETLVCTSGAVCLLLKLHLLLQVRPLPLNETAAAAAEALRLLNNGSETRLSLHSQQHHVSPVPLLVAFYLTNYFLFVRNYCIVVKAALTAHHIVAPMTARVRLTKTRVQLAYLSCYLMALAPVCARFSAETFSDYVSADALPGYARLLSVNHDVVHVIVFSLQGPLPAGLALVLSLAIAARLLLRRGPPTPMVAAAEAEAAAAAAPEDGGDRDWPSSDRLSRRAAGRVTLVAVTFATCELPTAVLAFLDTGAEETGGIVATRLLGNLLVLADSYCNLALVALSNRKFLRRAGRILGCSGRSSNFGGGGGGGGYAAVAVAAAAAAAATGDGGDCIPLRASHPRHRRHLNSGESVAAPLTARASATRSTIVYRV